MERSLCGCSGGHSCEETPGPIPNPEAKLIRADGTALGRVWESRSLPNFNVVLWGVSLRLPTVFLCKLKITKDYGSRKYDGRVRE